MPGGPGRFTQDSSCPALLRSPLRRGNASHTGLSPSAARRSRAVPLACRVRIARSYYPAEAQAPPRFGLFPGRSPLLGESLLFSLPAGTKMFQFPAFAPRNISAVTAVRPPGCPIRKSADQRPFAPTRGLSQLITSFIASVSQGIHRAPFVTFAYKAAFSRQPAHTFSCSARSPSTPKGEGGGSLLPARTAICGRAVFYSLACHNMSKIVSLAGGWRITDSNR